MKNFIRLFCNNIVKPKISYGLLSATSSQVSGDKK